MSASHPVSGVTRSERYSHQPPVDERPQSGHTRLESCIPPSSVRCFHLAPVIITTLSPCHGKRNLVHQFVGRSLALLIALMVPFVSLAQGASQPATDPAVHRNSSPTTTKDGPQPILRGQLRNGLRYAVLPQSSDQPGVALRMRVDGGFLAENRPGERGLAHLIEHLVFHSPTQSAPDQVRRFRQIGFPLSLPEPAGGTTSWRESDYALVSRTNKSADIEALLGLFREVASELIFRPEVVDEQRTEVMREMADKRLGNDIYASFIAAVAPGTPNDLIDAQNSDDVPTASIQTIRALYQRLYRPENTSIVIVGNVDPREIEAIIVKRFGDWQGQGDKGVPLAVPAVQSTRVSPISFSGLKYSRNVSFFTIAMPVMAKPQSVAAETEATLLDLLMIRALNNRLAIGKEAYHQGQYGSFIENGENGFRSLLLWDNFVPGSWRKAVGDIARIVCEIDLHGFSDAEWSSAKQGLLDELEQRAKKADEARSFEVALQLANALTLERAFFSPAELLLHAKIMLPKLNAVVSRAWWRQQREAGVGHLRVEAPELAHEPDGSSAIRAIVNAATQDKRCLIGQ